MGKGRGSPWRQEGVGFSMKIPGGGGCLGEGGLGEGPGRCLRDFGGEGAKNFFGGPKCPPRFACFKGQLGEDFLTV